MTLNLSSNAFFELNDFAVECQWTVVSSQDKYTVKGIFDNSFSPFFTMKTDDIPDGASDQNDLLLVPITLKGRVKKTSYRCKVIERDGTGISLIRLQLQ
mgnify:CR=1 FL=1